MRTLSLSGHIIYDGPLTTSPIESPFFILVGGFFAMFMGVTWIARHLIFKKEGKEHAVEISVGGRHFSL